MSGRRASLVFLPVFFASGFAALAYQIVWQRLLAFFSGADVFSVTLIVCAFMAGLGLGSLAGGHLADRLSLRGRFLAFALAEAATAAFALVSVPLLYGFLYRNLAEKALPFFLVGLLLFVVLLWPTFLMGLSLPLLSRALTEDAAVSARRIGSLYGWNTLGAALGALVTVFGVVRLGGFEAAVALGAALNLACAATALLALRWLRPAAESPSASAGTPEKEAGGARRESGFPFAWWLLLYAFSGFIALSLEILWFRLLGVIVKSNSFTFAWLLTLYLSGVGLGALLTRSAAARASRPGQAFLVLQILVAGYAGLSVTVLTHGVEAWPSLAALRAYLAEYDAIELDAAVRSLLRFAVRGGDVAPFAQDLATQLLRLYGLVPALLIGIPTMLMGASFPFLQSAVHADVGRLGRRVGWLQAANIAGATLGASLTGLVLLQALGTAGTLRVIVALGTVFALAATRGAAARARTAFAAAAV
ncbi:MAG TPA: fused MFS/spermidine synthase, partial [Vicinamibacteria bacterium]